ncbi:hypothetical protein BJV74DRAFT_797414 [Russula compacta]|nr:hypothetical protein BJV74DRAFT_797414 [Russula compacta]
MAFACLTVTRRLEEEEENGFGSSRLDLPISLNQSLPKLAISPRSINSSPTTANIRLKIPARVEAVVGFCRGRHAKEGPHTVVILWATPSLDQLFEIRPSFNVRGETAALALTEAQGRKRREGALDEGIVRDGRRLESGCKVWWVETRIQMDGTLKNYNRAMFGHELAWRAGTEPDIHQLVSTKT